MKYEGWKGTLSISSLSSIIMIIVTIVTFGISFIPKHSSGLLETKFTEGEAYAKLFSVYDSSYQRLGHKVGLLILVVLVLMAIVIKRRQGIKQLRPSNSVPQLIRHAKLYVGGLFLLISVSTLIINYGNSANIWSVGRLVIFPFFLIVLCIKLKQIMPKYYILWAAWLGNISYILVLTIPAFLTFIWQIQIQPTHLAAVQSHYVMVVSFADRLAINAEYFAQWLPNYGLILPSLLGAYQKHFGLLNFGQHVRVVQVFQVIFLLVAFLALYRWKPRRPVYILLALMFFGIYAGTANPAIFCPNASGWRFLGFPLWVLCLMLIKDRSPRPLSFILGCSSGFFLLLNLETGIVITLSNIIFFISRIKLLYWRKMLCGLVRFGVGVILSVLVFGFIFFLEFGRFPFSVYILKNIAFMNLFLSGFGGIRLKFDLLAIFIFMHCVYLVTSIIITWSAREIGSVASIKIAIASSILIWFAYYMNRADSWYLWTICFLYSFLLISFLNFRFMTFLWRKRGLLSLIDLRVAVFAWILLPVILLNNWMLVPNFVLNKLKGQSNSLQAPTGMGLSVISGVRVPRDIVALLERRAAFVKTMCARDKTIYLTRDTLLIPLMTSQCNLLNVQDVYLESIGPSSPTNFEHLIRDLLVINPKYILIDDPFSILSATDSVSAYRLKYFARIMNTLGDKYRKVRAESDWIIWERTID